MDTLDKIIQGINTLHRYRQEPRSVLMHPQTWDELLRSEYGERPGHFELSKDKISFMGLTVCRSSDVPIGDVHVLPNYIL